MKLAVCIIHNRDKNRIIDELVKSGFKFTIIGSTGGFLREGNTTFLIGTQDEEVPILRQVISDNCQSREQLVNIAPYETNPTRRLCLLQSKYLLVVRCFSCYRFLSLSVFDYCKS
jgi:uncharacterized protein YaaQ